MYAVDELFFGGVEGLGVSIPGAFAFQQVQSSTISYSL